MGAQVVDYRVSTLVVLCKDCGNDVGLYPARHKCTPIDRPAMPTLPVQYRKSPGTLDLNSHSFSAHSMTSSPSSSSNESPLTPKWSSSRTTPAIEDNDESIYFSNFAVNLPENNEPSGKKLWGKVRQNDKWQQLNEKNEKPKQTGKLWGKLIQATQTMAEKIPSRDDRGAESDEDDWEGETHVARVIREYYEKKHLPLPEWLFDEHIAVQRKKSTNRSQLEVSNTPMRTPSRRRLWEHDQDNKKLSSRERERQELRQAHQREEEDYSYHERGHSYHQERSYQRDENRYRQREENTTYHYRDEDRYRQREEEEKKYRQKEEEEEKYRYRDDDRYHQPRPDHHYKSSYREEEQYKYRHETKPTKNYYEDDHYNRPLSPPRVQQRPDSTGRQRVFEDSDNYYYNSQPTRSERSTRGYTRNDRYDTTGGHDLNDYYSQRQTQASRERSDRSYESNRRHHGHRYVNDNNYF